MDERLTHTALAFPPRVDPATGRFVLCDETERVRQSVFLILTTRRGERPGREHFGALSTDLAETVLSCRSLPALCGELAFAVEEQEPRVRSVSVTVGEKTKEGALLLRVSYLDLARAIPDGLTLRVCPDGSVFREEEKNARN